MAHEHVTYAEIIENFDAKNKSEKVSVQELREQCDSCTAKHAKVRYLLSYLNEKNYKPSEKVYNKLQDNIHDLESFYAFINESRLAKKGVSFKKNDNEDKKTKILTLKKISYVFIGIVALAFLILANFYYYKIVPGKEFHSLSQDKVNYISVTRKGLFFGSFNIMTNKLLLNKDIITVSERFSINTFGMRIDSLKNSTFGFIERNGVLILRIFKGEYYIDFEPGYAKKRMVLLPANCTVRVHSSRIYFNIVKEGGIFAIISGKADLHIPYQKLKNLDNDKLYSIMQHGNTVSFNQQKIEPKDFDVLLEKFIEKKNEEKKGTSARQ